MTQDMTVGSPTKLIIKFAIPLLIGNLFQQLYHISDIIIVGRLIGVNALAAVGASAPIFFVIMFITFGFTAGLTVVTAQHFGAHDEKGIRQSVTHSTIACAVLVTVITALMIVFMRKILTLMNVPTEIMDDAYNFITTLSYGLVVIVAYNLLSGIIRALGDSKTPLYFLIFSTMINILLNLFFIYKLKLGVIGSALGTIIAITISVVCCIFYIIKKFPLLRLSASDWKFDRQLMIKHLNIAVPMSLQFSIIALGLIIIQSVCNSFGPDTIAAFTSALRVEQLATQPLVALGLAIATYSAQNYGAGMIGRIRRGVFTCSLISLTFSIALSVFVRVIGEKMVGVFIENPSPNIIDTANTYLNISTLFYFFLGQIFIFRNALQGMGQSIIPLFAGIIELIMRSFAAIYLAGRLGYVGICYAGPIAWVGAALVVWIGYRVTLRKINTQHILKPFKWLKNQTDFKQSHLSHGDIANQVTPAE